MSLWPHLRFITLQAKWFYNMCLYSMCVSSWYKGKINLSDGIKTFPCTRILKQEMLLRNASTCVSVCGRRPWLVLHYASYSAFNEQSLFKAENCISLEAFSTNYVLCVIFLDKLCFPLQYSKNPYDQTKSINYIWNNTIQVSWFGVWPTFMQWRHHQQTAYSAGGFPVFSPGLLAFYFHESLLDLRGFKKNIRWEWFLHFLLLLMFLLYHIVSSCREQDVTLSSPTSTLSFASRVTNGKGLMCMCLREVSRVPPCLHMWLMKLGLCFLTFLLLCRVCCSSSAIISSA